MREFYVLTTVDIPLSKHKGFLHYEQVKCQISVLVINAKVHWKRQYKPSGTLSLISNVKFTPKHAPVPIT